MNRWFADSYFFLALLNHADEAHDRAERLAQEFDYLITTTWVLTEVGDAMARPSHRRSVFGRLLRLLRSSDRVVVVPATQALWDAGMAFYLERPDKEWALTDCISFLTMSEHGLREALTGDHHFEQAGFAALLK